MAQKTRELVKDIAIELIRLSNKAYADELIAYFYYKTRSSIGQRYPCQYNRRSAGGNRPRSSNTQEELAERIIQLGRRTAG